MNKIIYETVENNISVAQDNIVGLSRHSVSLAVKDQLMRYSSSPSAAPIAESTTKQLMIRLMAIIHVLICIIFHHCYIVFQ